MENLIQQLFTLSLSKAGLNFKEIIFKIRKAWSAQTCLSTQQTPETVKFLMSGSSKATMSGIVAESVTEGDIVEMQCLLLYSMILALGNPTVDFLSLDIEGAEFQVLKNIPWESVDIRAISVETQIAGEVLEGDKEDIFKLLLESIARDDIFVKLEPNQTTPKVKLQELLRRRSSRKCTYYRVPYERLSNYCHSMYPLDYFSPVNPESLPECLTRNYCPYDWSSLLTTYDDQAPWVVTLSDGCVYVDCSSYICCFVILHMMYYQGGTKRAALAAPLPGNFSEKPYWQEITFRTIHARKFGVDKSRNI
jgi:hypothetical protein